MPSADNVSVEPSAARIVTMPSQIATASVAKVNSVQFVPVPVKRPRWRRDTRHLVPDRQGAGTALGSLDPEAGELATERPLLGCRSRKDRREGERQREGG